MRVLVDTAADRIMLAPNTHPAGPDCFYTDTLIGSQIG